MILQQDALSIPQLSSILRAQIKNLMCKFVLPRIMLHSGDDLENIDYKERLNQKEDVDMFIGKETRALMQPCKSIDKEHFFSAVRQFYITSCAYMLKNYPYNDKVLTNAEVLVVEKRTGKSFEDLRYFVQKYPVLLQSATIDELRKEFDAYQVDSCCSFGEVKERIDTNGLASQNSKILSQGRPNMEH